VRVLYRTQGSFNHNPGDAACNVRTRLPTSYFAHSRNAKTAGMEKQAIFCNMTMEKLNIAILSNMTMSLEFVGKAREAHIRHI